MFVSVDVWAQLGKLADTTGRPVFPFIANGLSGQNALGNLSAATWNGNPLPATLPLNTRLQRIRFTNGVNILSVLPIRRFASQDARIQPYVGAGPAYFIIWSVVEADRVVRHARYHGAGGLGWTAVMGVRGKMSERWSWNAEFKVTSGPAEVPASADSRLSTHVTTRHQTVGVAWHY